MPETHDKPTKPQLYALKQAAADPLGRPSPRTQRPVLRRLREAGWLDDGNVVTPAGRAVVASASQGERS